LIDDGRLKIDVRARKGSGVWRSTVRRQDHDPVRVRTYIRCEFRIADWLGESTIIFGRASLTASVPAEVWRSSNKFCWDGNITYGLT
jgi:hypothetical protein